MVNNAGRNTYDETNTKNIGDNIMGAYYIPIHNI
jgi:hypothetical protein